MTTIRFIVLTALAVLACGCKPDVAPAGITCTQLRELRVGMTKEQVQAVLGVPLRVLLVQEPTFIADVAPGRWDWNDPEVSFFFANDTLEGAGGGLGQSWLGFFDKHKSHLDLFWLDEHGLQEFPDFERVYCPSR